MSVVSFNSNALHASMHRLNLVVNCDYGHLNFETIAIYLKFYVSFVNLTENYHLRRQRTGDRWYRS